MIRTNCRAEVANTRACVCDIVVCSLIVFPLYYLSAMLTADPGAIGPVLEGEKSETFLDRDSQYANNMPGARGKVMALHYLDKVTPADVEWNEPGPPKRVNLKYLVVV